LDLNPILIVLVPVFPNENPLDQRIYLFPDPFVDLFNKILGNG